MAETSEVAGMIDELQRFRTATTGGDYKINEMISIKHPTLGDICDFGEEKYYGMVSTLCSNPDQCKVMLWDLGIDWTTISDYELFISLRRQMSPEMTGIVLGDLDLTALVVVENEQTDESVLIRVGDDGESEIVFDRALYTQVVDYLRKMHGFESKVKKPENEHTKQYIIEREKRRAANRARRKKKQESFLKPMIASLVNHHSFKYDYNTVWG